MGQVKRKCSSLFSSDVVQKNANVTIFFLLILILMAWMFKLHQICYCYDYTSEEINSNLEISIFGKDGEPVSFKKILAGFPSDCKAASTINDVSPHLCFICLLHLANEHGLCIHGKPEMDDLNIHLPRIHT